MKKLVLFVIKNLSIIHNGSVFAKVQAVFKLSILASPFAWLIDKISGWYFENYGYIFFVVAAILIDHFIGTWVHAFIKKDFSLKKNIMGLFTKASLIVAVGVLLEGMRHIMGSQNFLTDYFSLISRLMVFVYPTGSALMNCAIITKGAFPPVAMLKRFKQFNSNLDLGEFGIQPKNPNEQKNQVSGNPLHGNPGGEGGI